MLVRAISRTAPLVVHSVLEGDAAVGGLDLPDAAAPEAVQVLLRNLHPSRQHVHYHVQFHRQLEQQTADAALAVVDGAPQGVGQRGGQELTGVLAGDAAGIKPDGLFDELVKVLWSG